MSDIIRRWIQDNAIPLDTLDPYDPNFLDLAPIKDIFDQVEVIGLGEATHGTREFFQIKHRLLRFLLQQLHFDTLAFETPFSNKLNSIIETGVGDLRVALSSDTPVVWQTSEILELIRWMRDHNRSHFEPKLSFTGIDCQSSVVLLQDSLSELTKQRFSVEISKLLRETSDNLKTLRVQHRDDYDFSNLGSKILNRLRRIQTLTMSEESWKIQDNLNAMISTIEYFTQSGDRLTRRNLRELLMFNNVRLLLERGQRVAIWAHNAHVSCDESPYRMTMGSHLRRAIGERYYALGITFYKGSFRSNFRSRTKSSETCIATVPPENIEHLLKDSGIPKFFLDIRSEKNPEIAEWWSQNFISQGAGAEFNCRNGSMHSYKFSKKHYDGVIFIEHTSCSIPLAKQIEAY